MKHYISFKQSGLDQYVLIQKKLHEDFLVKSIVQSSEYDFICTDNIGFIYSFICTVLSIF